MPTDQSWSLYIIRCSDGSLYTGITKDIKRRFKEHQSQGAKCAKYLRGKSPLKLVYSVNNLTQRQALQMELNIKKMPKTQKENLIPKNTKEKHPFICDIS